MIPYNTVIVLMGTGLLGVSAGLIGTFALLRRRALVGDALAHAALPGLCLAFLVVGERSMSALLAGAFLSGLVGVAVLSGLRRWTRIKEDAALGIVLSVFFGAGIVLSQMAQQQTTTGSKAGLDSYIYGKASGMIVEDVYLLSGLALACLTTVLALYKEFRIIAFDQEFARVEGWPVLGLDVLLLVLVAVTVVIGLPAVGVILMAALLIIPPAAARFWSDRLGVVLALAAVFGLSAGVTGTLVSSRSDVATGPAIVLAAAAVFLASLLLALRRGALAAWLTLRRLRQRRAEQDLLRVLFDLAEASLPNRPAVSVEVVRARKAWPPEKVRRHLAAAARAGLVEALGEGRFHLTEAGLHQAAQAARDHRLWLLFLVEHAALAGTVAGLGAESPGTALAEDVLSDLQHKLKESGRWPAGGEVLT